MLTLAGHDRRVRGIAYLTPEALVSVGEGGEIRLWDLPAVRSRPVPTFSRETIYAVAVDPAHRRIAIGGADHSVSLWRWDDDTGKRETFGRFDAPITALEFLPRGDRLVLGAGFRVNNLRGGICQILQLNDADRVSDRWSLDPGQRGAFDLASIPAAKTMPERIAVARNLCVILWDPTRGATQEFRFNPNAPFHPDAISVGSPVPAVAASPDGTRLALVRGWGIRIYDLTDRRRLRNCRGHRGRVAAIGYLPDGQRLASCGADGTVCLWDAITGDLETQYDSGLERPTALAIAPDGGTLAVAGFSKSEGQIVRVWDVEE